MKWLFFILGIGLSFILGYRLEPSMRFQLTGQSADTQMAENQPAADEPAAAEPASHTPPTAIPAAPAIDLASLSKEQLPERVLLKAEAEVGDATAELRMKIPAGSRVSLVRIENGAVVISPGSGPFEGTVPVAATDLLEQLAANPPAAVPAVAAQPVPVAEPEPVAQVEPEPAPEPVTPPAVVENEKEMEEAPSPTPPAANVDVVSVMQQSIRSGEIKEFTFEQVLGWKPEADETVDGETYQTGVAAYKADTIFGVKTIQAKALIKDGKVIRWIWPKSGMEIK